MGKKIKIQSIVAFLMALHFHINAQEQLMPLSTNAQLTNRVIKPATASKTFSITPMDTLPFFDDFSYSTLSPYPTAKHWIDSNVFVNHTFAIAPPSIGVATFDGLNKFGYPYNLSALVSNSSPADKLTSMHINLEKKGNYSYSPADSIYLSFYYQAEGLGDAPEANDSLSLDFYKPASNTWVKVWGKKGYNPGGADSLFHLVMIPIKDIEYFDSLFQFRFRNRATLSGSLDHWNIDYVYIDKNRFYADTIMEDDAFEYMSTSFLKNYSTMPYRHYIPSEMAPQLHNYMRNNFTLGKNTFYNYTVTDKNNALVHFYNGGSANILPYNSNGTHNVPQHANPAIPFAFPSLSSMGIFTIKHVISSNPDLQRQNDTIFQTQRFSDYYAYDDGTAEVGYYNNTYGAKNAVRYTLNVNDTLRGIRVYFDPVTDGQNIVNSTFRLMVWADGSNGPGNVIYRDSVAYPIYLQGHYNMMPTYKLTSCLNLNAGTYYFGLQQTTNKPLNIGFDKNNNHSNAFYYDIGSGWVQSAIKGSIMINPLLGCALDPLPVGIDNHETLTGPISIFPNPAQNSIQIETNGITIENATVNIISSIGQTVYSIAYNSHDAIDISNLPNGIYFVQLNSNDLSTQPVVIKKLIISR